MQDQLVRIAQQLKEGQVGVFPADTIYGLTCIPERKAIEALYKLKKRQQNQPFLMLLPQIEYLHDWVSPLTKQQLDVLHQYWPGPFTFIFEKNTRVLDVITGGRNTIAIRIPDFKPIIDLMRLLKQPLLSTSVNVSGQPSITSLDQLDDGFKRNIDFCFDGIKPRYGVESTLVDLSVFPFKIIRQGVGTFDYFG